MVFDGMRPLILNGLSIQINEDQDYYRSAFIIPLRIEYVQVICLVTCVMEKFQISKFQLHPGKTMLSFCDEEAEILPSNFAAVIR